MKKIKAVDKMSEEQNKQSVKKHLKESKHNTSALLNVPYMQLDSPANSLSACSAMMIEYLNTKPKAIDNHD